MKTIYLIAAIAFGIIGIAMTVLPFGELALIPLGTALIGAFLLYRSEKNQGGSTRWARLILVVLVLAAAVSSFRALTDTNVVDETNMQEREDKSKEEAIEELEGIEIDE